jgi:predicted transposase YdaD
MKESTTYQAILAEGRAEGEARGRVGEARRLLLLLGEKHLGAADAATREAIEALSDIAQLEALIVRAPDAENWAVLLGRATPRGRGRRKPS